MMRHNIEIQNLKCGGCAATIKTKLTNLEGVTDVNIDVDGDIVSFTIVTPGDINKVKKVLIKLGYPLVGENNKLFTRTKSYMSCAIGKLTSS